MSNLKLYLRELLGEKETSDLLKAAAVGKTIIIKGKQGPTGKSTLARILNQNGIKAIEQYEAFEVVLDKKLENPIAHFG